MTITFEQAQLRRYTDSHLAMLWHVAQANPAPFGDRAAGEMAERVGREIIRRWLAGVEPELWRHQGHRHYWDELCKLATYQPGGPAGSPDWERGTWVPKDASERPDVTPGRGTATDEAQDEAEAPQGLDQ